jgi:hypothetical protein
MERGSVHEFLDVTVERPALEEFQVEVGRTSKDRVQMEITRSRRSRREGAG